MQRRRGMKFEIKYKPSYSMLVVSLEKGETITGEAGEMTYMDTTIEPHTRKREKSLLGKIGRQLQGLTLQIGHVRLKTEKEGIVREKSP